MLIGISPVMSPELLATLYRMGHGEELVLADAHFPAESYNDHVIRADGIRIPELLKAIMPLINLDTHEVPLIMMQVVSGDSLDPNVEASYRDVIDQYYPDTPPVERLERFAFYERTKSSFAVVLTGETATYGNIILKKGIIPTGG